MTPYDAAYRDALAKATSAVQASGSSAPDAAAQAAGNALWHASQAIQHAAFADAFWIMGLFLLIIPLMF